MDQNLEITRPALPTARAADRWLPTAGLASRRAGGCLSGLLTAFVVLGACDGPPRPAEPPADEPSSPAKAEPAVALIPEQQRLLAQWYAAVGPKREGEPYGNLITRSGEHQLKKPYNRHPQGGGNEDLQIFIDSFQCVSFVETTLAVARCTWLGTRDEACFVREVKDSRYRDGLVDGYASRLHYFTDWINDNVRRKRLTALTQALGGDRVEIAFGYMTAHPDEYPSMKTDSIKALIAEEEKRLSGLDLYAISRQRVRQVQDRFADGDLVAIVGDKPGILIKHAGFVYLRDQQPPRMLHASSARKRVLVSTSIANYVERASGRRGLLIARPTPPRLPASGPARPTSAP